MDAQRQREPPGVPELIGRAPAVQRLDAALERAKRTGIGSFVIVTGQRGMGRSAFSTVVARRSAEQGFAVVERPMWEHQVPAGWPWTQVLIDLGVGSGGDDTLDPVVPIVDALVEQCRHEPTVIVVDDLHLAGPDALLFARLMARSVRLAPVVVVATWSGTAFPDDPVAAEIWRSAGEILELSGLSPADVDAVLDDYEPLAPAVREAVHREAGGNPLFIRAVVAQETGVHGVSPVVGDVVASALSAVDSVGQRVVLALALLGPGAGVSLLAVVLDLNGDEVLRAASASPELVVVDGVDIRLQSGVIAQAIRQRASDSDKAEIHERVVAALDQPTDHRTAAIRAAHARALAHRSVDSLAGAIAAGRVSAQLANRAGLFQHAADELERTVELATAHPAADVPGELLVESAEALLASGRLQHARERFDAAAQHRDVDSDARLLARATLGWGGIWVEEQRDAVSRKRLELLVDRAIQELTDLEAPDDALVGRLRVRRAAEAVYAGDRSVDDVRNEVDRLRTLGDPAALAEGLSLLHHTMLTPHHATARLDVADDLLVAATTAKAPLLELMGQCWRATDLVLLGDRGAEAALEELSTHAAARGCRSIEYIVGVFGAMRTFCAGDLSGAEAQASEAFELGAEVGDADAFAYYGGQLVALRWAQGRVDEIRPMIEDLARSSTLKSRDVVFEAVCAGAAAMTGDREAARRWLSRVGPVQEIPVFSTWLTTMFALTETAFLIDDAELASALLDELEPFADLPVRASLGVTCLGPTRRLLALLSAVVGELGAAVELMELAQNDVRRIGNQTVAVIMAAEHAELLRRRGDPADRQRRSVLLAEAVDGADRLGLVGRIDAWREELLLTGSPADVTDPRAAARTRTAVLEQRSDGWTLQRDGETFRLPDSVGMRHIAVLLERPDVGVAAIDLSTDGVSPERIVSTPLIDDVARRQYRSRIAELESMISAADRSADLERASLLRMERESLMVHLSSSLDRNGRVRHTSDHLERARMRVSKAIRRAIGRVSDVDDVIGRELVLSIRTGSTCVYVTDGGSREWTVRRWS